MERSLSCSGLIANQNSESKCLLDIQFSSCTLELPSLEHSSSKHEIRLMNLTKASYLNIPKDWFQLFIEKFIIKFRPHRESKCLLDIQISS